MNKYFTGFGVCALCGDTQGSWTWEEDMGWVCDDCEEKDEPGKLRLRRADGAGRLSSEPERRKSEVKE